MHVKVQIHRVNKHLITNVQPAVGEYHAVSSQSPTDRNKLDQFGKFVSMLFKILLFVLKSIHTDLPGVEVVGRTSVVVTNSGQSFYWSGFGFKLHSPPGSLPSGVDQCVLHIYASLAGQYQLPDNVVLVSAVFWVRCDPPCPFKQKLTLEIQHCGIVNASTKFTFVQASSRGRNQSKYTFSEMEYPRPSLSTALMDLLSCVLDSINLCECAIIITRICFVL